jgi:signal transduction histidine kinase
MRMDAMKAADARGTGPAPELDEIDGALRDALRDMRAIAAGLRMPELAGMGVRDVANRASSDHTRRTRMPVAVAIDDSVPDHVALPISIALFRAIQELLSNAYRHGEAADTRLHLAADEQFLRLEVTDDGPGFDVETLASEPGLGLAGMREQAELLGGGFEVTSRIGAGTVVRIRWPLSRRRATPGAGPAGHRT